MDRRIQELFDKRLLRKIPIDKEKINSGIKISLSKLEEAKKLSNAGFFGNAALSAYTSMFHASRALLYSRGIQEKSHYATYIYIKEKFSDKIPLSLINSFNSSREIRHNLLYGEEIEISEEDSESLILDAEDFLEEVKKILKDEVL